KPVMPSVQLGWADRAWELSYRFVRWWAAELAHSIPMDMRRRLFRRHEQLLARVQENASSIKSLENLDGNWRRLNGHEPTRNSKLIPAALVLSQQVVLRRILNLPYA